MTEKPVELRELARRDVDEAIDHYSAVATSTLALGFIDALEDAFRQLTDHPASGSPRYADELSLPGFRSRVVRDIPYLVFYVEREEHIDVWRVLRAARDIPVWLREPSED